MRNLAALLIISLTIFVSACAPADAPVMTGSSDQNDSAVYVIRGTIAGDMEEMVRQVAPARATMIGDYASYAGPTIDGKTILVISVQSITKRLPRPKKDSDGNVEEQSAKINWVSPGDSLVIKCVDTKCVALKPGHTLTFLCRRQYEALARSNDEAWDSSFLATFEIDYCRMETGVIK